MCQHKRCYKQLKTETKYITGVDNDESDDDDDDNVIEPVDVIRTFNRTELRHHFQMLQQHDRGACINTGCIHRGK